MTYSQKVGDWLFKQSGCTLQDFCKKFHYYPIAIKIMGLDEQDEKKSKRIIASNPDLKELYISCNKAKSALSRKGANRSWTQYFKDLICGWIIEDLVIEMLRRQGIDIIHNGRDAQRVIEVNSGVTQDADLLIKVGDVSRKVELTNELNPILEKNGFIEKRAPALFKLWESKGIWIYRDLARGKYVMVDFGTEPVKLHLRHHDTTRKDWDKDVHRYVLSENNKIVRDERLLAPEIIASVGCSIDGKDQPELVEIEDTESPPATFTVGGKFRNKNIGRPKADVPLRPPERRCEPRKQKEEPVEEQPEDSNEQQAVRSAEEPMDEGMSIEQQPDSEETVTEGGYEDYVDVDFV